MKKKRMYNVFLLLCLICNVTNAQNEVPSMFDGNTSIMSEWDLAYSKIEDLFSQNKIDECIKILLPFANKGQADAQNIIGCMYDSKGNITEARKWYDRAIKQNDVNAMFNMGLTYDNFNNKGIDEKIANVTKAKEYYKMAMETKEETKSKYDAYTNYSTILFHKENNQDDAIRIIRECLRTTERADLRRLLGGMYEETGHPDDAFRMYRIAAEYGDMRGMYSLAMAYMNPDNIKGLDIKKDYHEAIRWFTKIVEINDPNFSDSFGSRTGRALRYLNYLYAQLYYQTLNNDYLTQSIRWGSRYTDDLFVDDVLMKFYDEGLSDSKKYKTYKEWVEHIRTTYSVDSDIDSDIPLQIYDNKNTYILIIANEKYEYESTVPYAAHDGNIFFKYCTQLLNVPKENIRLITNATLNKIRHELGWLTDIASSHLNSKLIIYYAGHGIPAEDMTTSYLLPIDGFVKNVGTSLDINEILEELNKIPVMKTLIFDACFTGAKRDGKMLSNARGVAIKQPKHQVSNNTIVLSACSGVETAYAFEEQQHGMFTYYLLKGLKENNGKISLGELFDFVTSNVKKTSMDKNGKIQTPNIIVSSDLKDSWRSLSL